MQPTCRILVPGGVSEEEPSKHRALHGYVLAHGAPRVDRDVMQGAGVARGCKCAERARALHAIKASADSVGGAGV